MKRTVTELPEISYVVVVNYGSEKQFDQMRAKGIDGMDSCQRDDLLLSIEDEEVRYMEESYRRMCDNRVRVQKENFCAAKPSLARKQ